MAFEFNLDGLARNHIFASLLGSLVGLKFVPGETKTEKIITAAGGFGCGIFGTQVLNLWFPLPSVGVTAGMGFILGTLGMVIMTAVVKGIKELDFGLLFKSALSKIGLSKKED